MNALISAAAYTDASVTPGYLKAKSLEKLGDKTLIEHQVLALRNNGVDHIYIALPKNNKEIPALFKNDGDVHLLFVEEPLSTGGIIALAPKDENLLFVPGNMVFDVNLPAFFAYHEEKGAYVTSLVHPEPHPEKKDVLLVKTNGQGFIILPKETTNARDFYYKNIIPTDLCIVGPEILSTFDEEDLYPIDFHAEVFEPTLAVEGLFAYRSPEYVKIIRNTETRNEIIRDIEKGIPARKNLKNPQKAFFLDRDGTINIFGDFVVRPDMLQLIPDAAKAVKRINDEGYLALLATNQPVVARGETTPEEMANILAYLEMLLGKEGAYLDGIYHCPHYPKAFEGSNLKYTQECDCRKPGIGMITKGQKEFNLDLPSCWFIGDTTRDVQTGLNAGLHTALLLGGDPNYAKRYGDAKPEKTYTVLNAAIDDILGTE